MEYILYKKKILSSLRKEIELINYPLSYANDFNDFNNNLNFNCYAYALGLKTKDDFEFVLKSALSIYDPGTISGFDTIDEKKLILYDEKKLIEAFFADCDVLGIKCISTSIDSNVSSDASKVAIYIEPKSEIIRDFHFARQNIDGTWSNMVGAGGPVSVLYDNEVERIPGYNFLGAYSLKKKK